MGIKFTSIIALGYQELCEVSVASDLDVVLGLDPMSSVDSTWWHNTRSVSALSKSFNTELASL